MTSSDEERIAVLEAPLAAYIKATDENLAIINQDRANRDLAHQRWCGPEPS